MMIRRLTLPFAILLSLLLLVAAGWWMLSIAAMGPLEGETRHTFDPVALRMGEERVLEHTFHLKNASRRTISVRHVKPDCGCVTVMISQPLPATIEPGESFDVPIQYRLTNAGRTVPIYLDCGEDGIQALRVTSVGELLPRLSASTREVRLDESGRAEIQLTATVWGTYDPPPPAALAASAGIRATASEWTLKEQAKDLRARPSIWQATVQVEQESPEANETGSVTARIERADPVEIIVLPHAHSD